MSSVPVPSEPRQPSAFSTIPPVVKNLLILNGLAFFAQFVFDSLQTRQVRSDR